MSEIWRDIKEYEGLYQVSNYGRVKTLGNGKTKKVVKILSPRIGTEGYYYINLYNKGIRKTFKIHRLVANTFLPNPLNLPCVNHKDENKKNNNVENLEWCTNKYNSNYGTLKNRVSEKLSKPVLQFTKSGELINEWSSIMEIERTFGFYNGNISAVCNNKQNHKTAYGYIWKFKKEVD